MDRQISHKGRQNSGRKRDVSVIISFLYMYLSHHRTNGCLPPRLYVVSISRVSFFFQYLFSGSVLFSVAIFSIIT